MPKWVENASTENRSKTRVENTATRRSKRKKAGTTQLRDMRPVLP